MYFGKTILACSCRRREYEQKVRCSEKVAVRKASEVTRVYTKSNKDKKKGIDLANT